MENKGKRPDLRKFKNKTKIISFHCDAAFEGKGLAARELLLKVFKQLLRGDTPEMADMQKIEWILNAGGRI